MATNVYINKDNILYKDSLGKINILYIITKYLDITRFYRDPEITLWFDIIHKIVNKNNIDDLKIILSNINNKIEWE